MGLQPHRRGFLVDRQAVTVAAGPRHVAVHDLQRAGGPVALAYGEALLRDVQQLRMPHAGQQDGVVGRQQRRAALLARKHQRVAAPLHGPGQRVEAFVAEQQVAVREPHPVGAAGERRAVAADGAAEQLLARQGLPVPVHAGHFQALEIIQQGAGAFVFRAPEHRHGDLRVRRRERHQRAQLVHQQVGVVPAMADDLDVQAPAALRPRRGWRQVRLVPAGRNHAAGGETEIAVPPAVRPASAVEPGLVHGSGHGDGLQTLTLSAEPMRAIRAMMPSAPST